MRRLVVLVLLASCVKRPAEEPTRPETPAAARERKARALFDAEFGWRSHDGTELYRIPKLYELHVQLREIGTPNDLDEKMFAEMRVQAESAIAKLCGGRASVG